jgi:hypothetical protein
MLAHLIHSVARTLERSDITTNKANCPPCWLDSVSNRIWQA